MEKKNWKFRLGLALIIISCLVFVLLIALPFLEITDKNKIIISTVIIVIGEVLFWSGSFLLGRELIDKYKAYLHPKKWFKRRNKQKNQY
jgi:hypothetical protein